ncbi:MAG TPA: hypothetical protein V6C65_36805 [Allocoleopsis sp.]
MKLLDEDVIDLAIAPFESFQSQFERQHLLEPGGLCGMRKGHPLAGKPLTLKALKLQQCMELFYPMAGRVDCRMLLNPLL